MTPVILTLSIAYAALAVLLAVILLSTRVPLILRALATIAVIVLAFATYWGIGEIRGLPSDTQPPELFRMHWARIVEPDKISGEEGAIYLWLEELDKDFYPSGLPRAYRLPYSRQLADAVEQALAEISDGTDVAGEISEDAGELDTSDRLALEITGDDASGTNSPLGERVLQFDFGDVSFRPLPAPITPEKTND